MVMNEESNKSPQEYIQKAKQEIERWESQGPGFLTSVGDTILWPAQKLAEQLIPEGVQESVSEAIAKFLSGISSLSERLIDKEQVLEKVNSFKNENASELEAMDKAAKHYWNWHISYAAVEGAGTGAPGIFGLPADIPLLFGISFRQIQQIGTCFGYDTTSEEEQEYVLKILQTGSTGDIKAKVEFLVGLKQIEQILLKVTWKRMNAAMAAKEIGKLSSLAALRQFAKSMGIQLTKRKALQIVPVVAALVGASFNAVFVNDIGRAAYMSYRRRRIAELNGPEEKVTIG